MPIIRILEKSHAIEIIITLSKKDEMSLTELIKQTKGSIATTNDRLGELIRYNIINETYEKKFQGKRLISLTPKGKLIGALLTQIEELL